MADEGDDIGELTVGEMRAIQSAQGQMDNLIREIGALEVRKARCLDTIRSMETRMNDILASAAQRLGIKLEEMWHVTPEGRVRRGTGQPS